MEKLTNLPYAERLRQAMIRYLDDPRHEEPTFVCHECQDTGYRYTTEGNTSRCMNGRCPAWDEIRAEASRYQAAKRRRRQGRDEVPF